MKLPLEPTIIDDKINNGINLRGEVMTWPDDTTRSTNDGKRGGREEERNVNERGGRLTDPTVTADTDTDTQGETAIGDGKGLQEIVDKIDSSDVYKSVQTALQTKNLNDFIRAMEQILEQVNNDNLRSLHDYSKETRLSIAESLYNQAYNLALQKYNNDYQWSLWIAQQEYNSPMQQMQRLEAAGLAGAWSMVNSNTAQGVAGSDEGTALVDEGWGNIEATVQNAKKDRIIKGVETAIGLGTSLISGYTALKQLPAGIEQMRSATALNTAQEKALETLTPQQLRNLIANQKNIVENTKNMAADTEGKILNNNYTKASMNLMLAKLRADYQGILKINSLHDLQIANFMRDYQIREEANRINAQSVNQQMPIATMQAETQRYGAELGAKTTQQGNLLGYMGKYSETAEEEYFEADDHTSEISSDIAGKIPGLAKVKVGGRVNWGGKTYTKKRRQRIMPSQMFKGVDPVAQYDLLNDIRQDLPVYLSREAADAYTRPIWQGEWVK